MFPIVTMPIGVRHLFADLAVALSFVMLGFSGVGRLVNISYQLDSSIHDTQ
jgi:hypothetical protein